MIRRICARRFCFQILLSLTLQSKLAYQRPRRLDNQDIRETFFPLGVTETACRSNFEHLVAWAEYAGKPGLSEGAPNESNPYSFGAPRWIKKGNSSIQTQKNGFGSFIQSFQRRDGKSKYGMPIFLPNGNVNPAYLAAERADIQSTSKKNTRAAEKKRKDLIKAGKFQLADYVRKEIGPAGSGRDFYQSGR